MDTDRLQRLHAQGEQLLSLQQPLAVHAQLQRWASDVASFLRDTAVSQPGLVQEWEVALDVDSAGSEDDTVNWWRFRQRVRHGLNWLAALPERLEGHLPPRRAATVAPAKAGDTLVDTDRVLAMKQLALDGRPEFAMIARLCEELNLTAAAGAHLALPLLARALIEHLTTVLGAADPGLRQLESRLPQPEAPRAQLPADFVGILDAVLGRLIQQG